MNKRFFLVSLLTLCSLLSFGQRWDVMKSLYFTHGERNYFMTRNNEMVSITSDYYPQDVTEVLTISNCSIATSKYVYEEGFTIVNQELVDLDTIVVFKVPDVVFDEYLQGRHCFITGCISLSIGTPVMLVGACFIKRDPVVSTTLLSIGGTLVGVSLPLMTFGDHIKREANINLEMYNLLETKKH